MKSTLLPTFLCLYFLSIVWLACNKENVTENNMSQSKLCCQDTGVVKGTFNPDSVKILIPTAFTPNQDGLNDFFRPYHMGLDSIYWKVTRNGITIFKTDQLKGQWNGEENGKILSETYQYQGTAFSDYQDTLTFKGSITIVLKNEGLPCSDCQKCRYEDQIDPRHGFTVTTAEPFVNCK